MSSPFAVPHLGPGPGAPRRRTPWSRRRRVALLCFLLAGVLGLALAVAAASSAFPVYRSRLKENAAAQPQAVPVQQLTLRRGTYAVYEFVGYRTTEGETRRVPTSLTPRDVRVEDRSGRPMHVMGPRWGQGDSQSRGADIYEEFADFDIPADGSYQVYIHGGPSLVAPALLRGYGSGATEVAAMVLGVGLLLAGLLGAAAVPFVRRL